MAVVLDLAVTVLMWSRKPRMPTSIRLYGGSPTAAGQFAPAGWKRASWGELAEQRLGLVVRRIDDFRLAGELDGRVVARRHAVFVRVADLAREVLGM